MMEKLLTTLLYACVALLAGVVAAFGLELYLLLRLIVHEL